MPLSPAVASSLLFATMLLACSDAPTRPAVPDDRAALELADPGLRLPAEYVNAHMYGSFVITGGNPGGVIVSGPAHFPGHPPAGPGTCDNGLWINAQGNRTAGAPDKPHPHCYQPPDGIDVVLEPISVCHTGLPDCALSGSLPMDPVGTRTTTLFLSYHRYGFMSITGVTVSDPKGTFGSTNSTGEVVVGYAIDGSTIATTPRRVGWMTIDLAQFNKLPVNLLDGSCALDGSLVAPCLNLVIEAGYKPFAAEDGGIGSPGTAYGFLWFTPATTPYNYN